LVFLEFSDEADAYVGAMRSGVASVNEPILISLNPRVRADLKQRGMSSEDTLAYFGPDAHARSLRRSAEACEWIRERFRFVDGMGVGAAYRDSVVWYCRQIAHYCLWGVELLAEAVEKRRPSLVVAGAPMVRDLDGHLMHDGERYLGLLAQRLGEDRKIPVTLLATPRDRRASLSRGWSRFLRLVSRTAIAPILAPVHRRMLAGLAARRPVMFTTTSYRMDDAARRMLPQPDTSVLLGREWPEWRRFLKSSGGPKAARAEADVCFGLWDAISREDRDSRRALAEALARLAEEVHAAAEIFTHRGVSFADVVARKLRVGITPFVLALHRRAATFREVLETVKPSAVVSVGARDDDMVFGELCRKLAVPALMASHGSHVPPRSDLEEIEWGEQARRLIRAPYPAVALQSPLAEGFLATFPTSSVAVRTGPVVWGRAVNRARSAELRRRLFPQGPPRRVIVHAGTPKRRGSIRFHVYETLDEYAHTLSELARAVQRMAETRLIVTFRPHAELRAEDLRALLPPSERVSLNTDLPFLDLLGMADLLVSFSSTTIEEALQNGVPVLLYGGNGRYRHVPAVEVLPERPCPPAPVYAVRRPEHLVSALSNILEATGAGSLPDALFQPYRYRDEERCALAEWLSSVTATRAR
jgi:hypothetical protein